MSCHIDTPIFLCEGLRIVSCMLMPSYNNVLSGIECRKNVCAVCKDEHHDLKLVYEYSLRSERHFVF